MLWKVKKLMPMGKATFIQPIGSWCIHPRMALRFSMKKLAYLKYSSSPKAMTIDKAQSHFFVPVFSVLAMPRTMK